MQGMLALLQALPRDTAVTNGTLLDWLLPLFEDARDEYHALATDNSDQIEAVVLGLESARAEAADDATRQVVVAAVGLAALAYQRSGWMNKDLGFTMGCPKDMAEEFTKVQVMVQAWSNANAAADAAAAADDDDDNDDDDDAAAVQS